MFKKYYQLTKPGIIYGNLLTAIGGFLFASQGDIDLWLMAAVVSGTAFVIGSACVVNNYLDRKLDARMARTKKRALVDGAISVRSALAFAVVLGLAGFLILVFGTNAITVVVGTIGYVDYLVLYSFAKRRSTFGTLVGSIAGATAVTAGYTAVTGRFDGGALILFLIMAVWQMPHFYAIATFRRSDYAAAGLPVLPVKKSALSVKRRIIAYICAYLVAVAALTVFDFASYTYLVVMLLLGLNWLRLGLQGFKATDDVAWARKMFGFSLVVLLGFSALISLDAWLP